MHRLKTSLAAVVTAIGLWAVPAGAPLAQQVLMMPWIAPEFLDETRSLDDDELTFCLNPDSVLVEFDRAVAQAIADTLLLKATFHEVTYPTDAYAYDFRLPLTESQLFVTITNHCDALMGYRVAPNSTPDWATVSRPYFETKMLMASTNESYRSFGDLPAGEKVGARMAGTGHRELRTFLQSLPKDRRPSQVPYPNNELLVERLTDGTLSTILIWEYAPYYASGGDFASLGIKSVFAPPFAVPLLQFSAVMLKQDTFVRGLIDDAIGELMSNGTLEQIAAQYLPPSANPA